MPFQLIRRGRPDWYSLPLSSGASGGRVLACRDAHGMVTIVFDATELTGASGFLTTSPTGLTPAGPTTNPGPFASGRAHFDVVPAAFVDVRVYKFGVQLQQNFTSHEGKVLHGQFSYRTDETGPINGVKI